jgi:phenylalanyl-tRNA synthetase beta chain
MKLPLSWLKDYVDITLDLEQLAKTLTMAGLEVDGVTLVGLPMPPGEKHEFKYSGLTWERDKIVVAEILEVKPHPNADRLVLCRLNDGELMYEEILTGAPNLFQFKGIGPLNPPLKVAYAKEGARIYDGHQPGLELTTLKRAKIRGVESFSMVCSEKELGISEEHEGIILFDEDAPTGMPLVDYIGDAVFELSILPNMIRNACVLGVARELAAITNQALRQPALTVQAAGPAVTSKVKIEIKTPELNPRFTAGLIENVTIQPSPWRVQHRLKLAGMRPINNIVDATNYLMLELGQPLHAFDYDALKARAAGKTPTIITRQAAAGEKLTTLDGVDRKLDAFTVLVCDTTGPLSIAGVMGGAESEVSPSTRTVLLEGASWNFINIRKTVAAQKLASEAGYRFSRGVHPSLTAGTVSRCLELMRQWSGGVVDAGLVDAYPLPAQPVEVTITEKDVRRILGISLKAAEIVDLLRRLGFSCQVSDASVKVTAPDFRLDIGTGAVGRADVLEEIARIYGYERIPETRLEDKMPPQFGNPSLEREERLRDVLANLGTQEVVSYRLTTPEREARLTLAGAPLADGEYVALQNPITPERRVMRRSLLSSVMDALEKNARTANSLALFEVGNVYIPVDGQTLPDEQPRVAVVMAGLRHPAAWDVKEPPSFDFFDLKGLLLDLAAAFQLPNVRVESSANPALHPGKQASLLSGDVILGQFGALHPLVKARYEATYAEILTAEIDLRLFFECATKSGQLVPVPAFPPILEDIAIIVDEAIPAGQIEALIRQTGGKLLADVSLFDIFRGAQIGAGKKSMAYSLTYQAPDRTLTDKDATAIRQKIIRRLELEFNAKLRG